MVSLPMFLAASPSQEQAAGPIPFRGVNENSANIDVGLLERIAQCDQQAFGQFYDRYSTLLFSIILRILSDHKEAEDVLQDAFVQIWEKAGNYRSALGTPLNWAITLVRNKAIDRLRALHRRYKMSDKLAEEPETHPALTDNSVVDGENAALLRTALKDLPQDQRQAIELAFFGGLTQHEIAESLQEPLGTIKARIRRGMLKLRDALEGRL